MAPVPAGKVAVNLGGPKNAAFQQVKGDRYILAGKVKYAYVSKPPEEPLAILLPEEKRQTPGNLSSVQRVAAVLPEAAGDGALMERELLERFDGTLVPLQPSKPIARGSDLTGAEIYRLNCAACHGEGITGKPLQTIATTQREEIKKVPLFGRFEKGMPPWGKGVDELAGVLTEKEIDRVVDYIKNELFKKDEIFKEESAPRRATWKK